MRKLLFSICAGAVGKSLVVVVKPGRLFTRIRLLKDHLVHKVVSLPFFMHRFFHTQNIVFRPVIRLVLPTFHSPNNKHIFNNYFVTNL